MSGSRVRRRVEEEARAEDAWALDEYEWDPITCVARKRRLVAPGAGEATVATNTALAAMRHVFLEGAPFQAAAENPSLASLPVLETVDRTDAEPATVCEVVGCGASLEGLKRYYVRMRVCERHLHAPAIVVNGVVSRFCQQCAKFQFVGEFSGSKKSCIATLERHNARHRAKVLARMQELHDGDSDSAPPAGVRAKGRARAAGGRGKAGKPPPAAATAAAGRMATERTDSGTSAAGTPDSFGWAGLPQGQAMHGFQQLAMDFGGCGGGAYATAGQGLATAPPPGVRSLSASAPVLSAEATAPSKPASPHVPANVWDGASSSHLELPPRPLVTTGGNAVVSTGDRTLLAPAGGGAPAAPAAASGAAAQLSGPHPPHAAASMPSWQLQQQHQLFLPSDVRSSLEAIQGQLLSEVPDGNGAHAGPARQAAPVVPPGAWQNRHPQLAPPGLPAGATPRSQAAASGGSTPSTSNAMNAFGSDASAAKTSQATARQAMQAATGTADGAYPGCGTYPDSGAGGGDRLYGSEGLQHQPVVSKSGGSHQSDAEPCGSSGRVVATNAASPMLSQDEGVSATRVSASGGRMGGGGSGFVDGGGGVVSAAAPLAADDVAARISCIMQELCPLIEQFKKEVTHGSVVGQHDSAFAAATAAAGAAPQPPLLAAAGPTYAGDVAQDSVGPSSLVDNAVAMMQTASQLAASLQQSRSSLAPPPVWTVTSGGSEPRLPSSASLGPPQGSAESGLMRASSHPSQPLPQPPQRAASLHPPGWRPLASNPGIVVNAAAVQHATSYAVGSGTAMSATVPGSATSLSAVPGMPFPPGSLSVPPPPLPGGVGLAMSASPTSTTTTTANVLANQTTGGYSGAVLSAGAAAAVYPATGGVSNGAGCGGGVSNGAGYAPGPIAAPGSGPVVKGEDSDDEMFQQLLTLLEDEGAGDDFAAAQQQQQQLFQSIASTAQHAVGVHQQTLQAMPYGHVPASPFYWPAQAQAPPPAAPSAPHHHQHQHQHYHQLQLQQQQQPQHFRPQHVPVQSTPFGWPNPAPPVLHVEEPDDVDPRELTRVSLKAMNALPHELPSNLRSNLRRWLKEARAEALQSTLRPGCVQLVVDVLRPASAAAAEELSSVLIPAHDADQAAADVFRVLGQRLRDTYVQVDRRVLQMRIGERPVVLSWEEAAWDGGLDGAKYPALCGCSAAAACAGSEAVLQLSGDHLSHPGTKVYARLRGHDLNAELLPAEAAQTAAPGGDGGGRRLRMKVVVPPGSVGLMAVEVGVGHLLGDWWPVLVLPPGCEGAAAEVGRLQAEAEATARGQDAGGAAAGRAFRRLLLDLAKVLEVFFDTAAADASAAAANAAAAAAAAAAARARSSNGSINGDAAAPDAGAGDAGPAGSRSPPPHEGRCPSPSGGSSSNVSRSDASFTAVSAGGWSYAGRTDTLLSTNAGSTLGSFMTTSSALTSPSAAMAAGQAHAQAQQAVHHLPGAVVGGAAAAAAVGEAAAAAPAASHVILLPPPPSASIRQALSRAARLVRFAVARGLPHLTALLLAAAHCLARALDGNRQPAHSPSQPLQPLATAPQAQTQAQAAGALPNRAELLAGAGIDLQSLLPLAVLSGSADTVDRLMVFAARVLGSPLRLDLPQGPGSLSALHLAALLPDGGALAGHLVATQPWAAWEWLTLGWTPPESLMATAAAACPGGRAANGSGAAKDDATRAPEPGLAAPAATGDVEYSTDEEEDEAVLRPGRPGPPRLTPGLLSVLLGGKSTVRKAAEVLVARRGGGGASLRPGTDAAAGAPTAALVAAVEAWGRTGVALLEALCAQLAQQRL